MNFRELIGPVALLGSPSRRSRLFVKRVIIAACAAVFLGWWLRSRVPPPNPSSTGSAAASSTPAQTVVAQPSAPLVAPLPPAHAPALLDEPALMAELHRVDGRDPELCLVLARDGNARFPDSPDAPERAALAIKSLALTGHVSEARGEAEFMVNHYPPSRWTQQVEQHTGAHPHRSMARLP